MNTDIFMGSTSIDTDTMISLTCHVDTIIFTTLAPSIYPYQSFICIIIILQIIMYALLFQKTPRPSVTNDYHVLRIL